MYEDLRLFREWNLDSEPPKELVQLVYDFEYPDEIRNTPSVEIAERIKVFLTALKLKGVHHEV